jgi:hypothetical protein
MGEVVAAADLRGGGSQAFAVDDDRLEDVMATA